MNAVVSSKEFTPADTQDEFRGPPQHIFDEIARRSKTDPRPWKPVWVPGRNGRPACWQLIASVKLDSTGRDTRHPLGSVMNPFTPGKLMEPAWAEKLRAKGNLDNGNAR